MTTTYRDPVLHVLQHALGLDDHGRGPSYRNRFVTDEGSNDYDLCMDHVAAGRMIRSGPSDLFGGGGESKSPSYCFTVTEAGRVYVREHSPKPPTLTRSQQRYRAYLGAGSGLSFGEWLLSGGERR